MPKAIGTTDTIDTVCFGQVPCYISPVLTAVRCLITAVLLCAHLHCPSSFFFSFCCEGSSSCSANAAAIKAPMTGTLCREKYEIELCDWRHQPSYWHRKFDSICATLAVESQVNRGYGQRCLLEAVGLLVRLPYMAWWRYRASASSSLLPLAVVGPVSLLRGNKDANQHQTRFQQWPNNLFKLDTYYQHDKH